MVIINEIEEYQNLCPECNGYIVLISEKGEDVCSQCGLVINEKEIDVKNSGRRTFTQDEKNKIKNYGWPISPLVADLEICTKINKNETNDFNLKRVIKRDSIYSWKTRNFLIAFAELKRLCFNLNIPSHIKIEAVNLYKKCFTANLLKGRSISGMIAACLYYVSKKMNTPVMFKEIIYESTAGVEIIKKCYKALVNKFKLTSQNLDPVLFIPKYSTDLDLDIETQQLAVKILTNYLKNNDFEGKNPMGLCGGAIYFAAKLKDKKITQKQITDITLISLYKEINEKIRL
jgi:transcription initiation factor TFIIB